MLNTYNYLVSFSIQEFESPDESGSYTDYLKQVFLNSTATDFPHNEKQDLEAKIEPEMPTGTPAAMGSPNGVSTTIISTEELHFPSSSNSESGRFPQTSSLSYINSELCDSEQAERVLDTVSLSFSNHPVTIAVQEL